MLIIFAKRDATGAQLRLYAPNYVIQKWNSAKLKKIKFSDYLVGWRIIRTFASRLYPNLTIHGSHKTFGRV
ncbi:MAG: hypothetical protein ACI4UW_03070 [Muribaculaceae bacterium]